MVSKPLAGVIRSLRLYHGAHAPCDAMDRVYAPFVTAGDLVFDIGAHVGDRVSSFRRLGATVVAVEPQPQVCRALRLIHGRDPHVTVRQLAIGDAVGWQQMQINSANPTVSTLSGEFIASAQNADGWRDQDWESSVAVPTTTLDKLIEEAGLPQFIKIDVEGYENKVLAGLHVPVAALSFEFTTIARDCARTALQHCERLGFTRFNLALGETQRLELPSSVGVDVMRRYLDAVPQTANSGDIYASRVR